MVAQKLFPRRFGHGRPSGDAIHQIGGTLTARHKLNAAYFQGALIIAGILGAVTESYLVFFIALASLLVGNLLAGEIRR
jgi:hypothetical protein